MLGPSIADLLPVHFSLHEIGKREAEIYF